MRSKYPDHIELAYRKMFINSQLRLAKLVIPRIKEKFKAETVKTDESFLDYLNTLLYDAKLNVNSDYIERTINDIFADLQSWSIRQNVNVIKVKKASPLTINLAIASLEHLKEIDIAQEFLKNFWLRNIELVIAAGQEYIDDIYMVAEQGYLNGDSLKTMAEKMKTLTNGNIQKAEFWARDQIGDAWSEYNHQAQNVVGVTEYIWRTVGDNHVRGHDPDDKTSHVVLEGQRFTWKEGSIKTGQISKPGAKHPGEDYNCRCFPEPVLPGE